MRFNREDLRRGNVSQERIQEIVLQTILKVDERYAKQVDIVRMSSSFISSLEKEFKFKKLELYDKEMLLEKENYKKNMEDLHFFTKLKKVNIEVMNFEAVLMFMKIEEIKTAILARMDLLNRLRDENRITELQHQQNMLELKAMELQILQNERNYYLQKIAELNNYIENLEKVAEEHEKNIRAARKYHSQIVMNHLNEVTVGGVKTFEGMSQKDKEKFVNGYFAIKEIAARQLVDVDRRIMKEEQRLHQQNSDRSVNGSVTFSYKQSPKLVELKKERQDIKVAEAAKLAELCKEANFVSPAASDDTRKAHLAAFEKHEPIKKQIEEFVKEVKKEHANVLDAKEKIEIAKEEVKETKNQLHKVEAVIEDKQENKEILFENIAKEINLAEEKENIINIRKEEDKQREEKIENLDDKGIKIDEEVDKQMNDIQKEKISILTKNSDLNSLEEFKSISEIDLENLDGIDFDNLNDFDSDLFSDDNLEEINLENCTLKNLDCADVDLSQSGLEDLDLSSDKTIIRNITDNKGPEKTSGHRL